MIEVTRQLQHPDFRFLRLQKKDKKPIAEETNWQDKNYKFDDPKLLEHLKKEMNYAIIGGYGNLILIDSDTKEIEEICEKMIDTFTVKTGSPEEWKKHYFFITDRRMKGIRLTKEKVGDLGDVRSIGQYVVAPNSIHPKGGTYKVIKDIPIAKIGVEQIKGYFKDYLGAGGSEDFKEYPTITTKRSNDFIRSCLVPDYVINNKLKGNTSKNWELFPYLVDILHNREVTQDVYVNLCKRQGHNIGAIKGWVRKAHEGKLMKCSCEKMQNYLNKFHPTLLKEVCGSCQVFLKKKAKDEKYTELQNEVRGFLLDKKRDDATEVIVDFIENENHIYTTKDDIKSEMWIYKDGVYKPEGKSEVKEQIRKILGKTYNSQIYNRIIEKIEADTFIEHDDFFKTNYLDEVPVKNGILNIFTKELAPFNPKKIFFNKLPVEYSPGARCPNILKFLSDVLKHVSDIDVMIEIIGFCLLKEYRFEKAFMFVGNGRNGKSKTLELIKKMIGIENCCSVPLSMITADSTSVIEMFGKMVNLAGDLSNDSLKKTGMFKQTVGRDVIAAKRKYLRDLIFVNYAKHIFAANELPKVYDLSDGFWTKWLLLEFPYKFIPKKEYDKLLEDEKIDKKILDPNIIDKIATPQEMSGLFNLALDSLKFLLEKRDFSYSKGTKEIKELWIRQSDSFAAFCIDAVEEDYEARVTKKELRMRFHRYCKVHKLKGVGDKAIKATLEDRFGVIESQSGLDGNRYWEGIKFRKI